MLSTEERFWSKVDKSGDCWLWTSPKNKQGYGVFSRNGTMTLAHRVADELSNGPIPDGMFVCHRCDVPACVNPEHLFHGSHADNMADRNAKGRQARPRGELSGTSVLNDQTASLGLWMATLGVPQRAIAYVLNVSQTSISSLVRGRTWKHLQGVV